MGRRIDVDDIVTPSEIADMFCVSRAAVSNWTKRREITGFPEPVKALSIGGLYSRTEVEEWAETTGRVPTEEQILAQMATLKAQLARIKKKK